MNWELRGSKKSLKIFEVQIPKAFEWDLPEADVYRFLYRLHESEELVLDSDPEEL